MKLVKTLKIGEYEKLIGSKVHFISDCEFFPNFNIIVKIVSIEYRNNEILFQTKTKTGKKMTIGSNMKNLQFELV